MVACGTVPGAWNRITHIRPTIPPGAWMRPIRREETGRGPKAGRIPIAPKQLCLSVLPRSPPPRVKCCAFRLDTPHPPTLGQAACRSVVRCLGEETKLETTLIREGQDGTGDGMRRI